MDNLDLNQSRRAKNWVLVIWPAFLGACLLEAMVFSMVDPREIHWFGQVLQPTRQSVYSVAFFGFWLIVMFCNSLVLWLANPVDGSRVTGKTAD
ncbi:MAG: hypothetical protein V4772_19385 [Pseudomonadota bacterium]